MSTERTLENFKVFSVLLCEVSEESRADRARVSETDLLPRLIIHMTSKDFKID